MRLIDANKVVKVILAERDKIPRTVPAASYELVSEKPFNHGNSMRGGIRKALRCIEQAPTVDAVPVVRKPVVGYEGYYEVDQFGRVFSVERVISVDDNGRKYEKPVSSKQMKQCLKNNGYKSVSLTKGGVQLRRSMFIGLLQKRLYQIQITFRW